jgi:uncharacterized membrane protein YdbT with pleckstrin-like domain
MSAEVDGSRRYRALLKQTLQEDEDLVQVVRLKWVKLLRPGLVLLGAFLMALVIAAYLPLSLGYRTVLSLAVLVVGSGFFAYNWLFWKDEFMIITSKRVVLEKGVFTRSTKEIPLNKINNVSCQQSPFGRIFHYGNIEIASANLSGSEKIICVPEPLAVRSTIATASTKETPKAAVVPTVQADSSGPRAGGLVDDLERLALLLKEGMLTEREFQVAKDRLLHIDPSDQGSISAN